MPRGAKTRMRRNKTPKPNWIKFCLVVDIADIVTYINFGDHRLRGIYVPPLPLTFIVALTTHKCKKLYSLKNENRLFGMAAMHAGFT